MIMTLSLHTHTHTIKFASYLACNIIESNNSIDSSIVRMSDTPEPLLTSAVPLYVHEVSLLIILQ